MDPGASQADDVVVFVTVADDDRPDVIAGGAK